MRVGAIDVGTNSIHLLVANLTPDGEIQVLEKARVQVELGSGGGLTDQNISAAAMERGINTLLSYKQACDTFGAVDIACSATSAVREAANGDAFVKLVRERTGVHIKPISGAEEARLIYLGCRDSLDFSAGRVLLVDLGGGSTEFILASPEEALVLHSIRLGHIRLTETHVSSDPISSEQYEAAKAEIKERLSTLKLRIRPGDFGSIVGTSGTVRALARMSTLARGDELPEHNHGLLLRRSELEDLIQNFRSMQAREYVELPGMDMRRKRTLPQGAMIIRQVLKTMKQTDMYTSERSLLYGLLVDWMLRHKSEITLSRTVTDPRRRTCLTMMARYGAKPEHAKQVAMVALALFDGTAELHGLGIDDRRLLEFASLLHDIGHHVSGQDHNKHGAYIVQHTRMHGFTAPEVAILGNLVRYHRGSKPKTTHKGYAALSSTDRHRVRVMSGILRIADALDRSHGQPVDHVTVDCASEDVRIRAFVNDRADLERWAVQRRTPPLSSALHRPVIVEMCVAQPIISSDPAPTVSE
jgi:exopolyphosphatase / guanosine-5'-triphosphate,3'-diphosphate pyrophosphatase